MQAHNIDTHRNNQRMAISFIYLFIQSDILKPNQSETGQFPYQNDVPWPSTASMDVLFNTAAFIQVDAVDNSLQLIHAEKSLIITADNPHGK